MTPTVDAVIEEVRELVSGKVYAINTLRGDLAMDSLDAVDLQMRLEERFGLREYDLGGYPLWAPFYMPHMQRDPTIREIAKYVDEVCGHPKLP